MVHDYGSKPANAPNLHEFDHLDDPSALQHRRDIKLAVICCPRPQYRSVTFVPGMKVLTPWKR
jgi:UDPglucose 6-dehydrogenase